jgi:ABC-type transport system involved in multi-copper enzyme maturation permease subunit
MWPIFTKTLYDSRKLILWLFLGFAFYGMITAALYPIMVDAAEDYNKIMEAMPSEMLAFIGMGAEDFDMGNLGQFLHMYMMLYLLLTAGAVAIYQAFNAFTNAERDNSMDMLLSLPISRRENLLGQYAATVVTAIISLLGAYLGVIVTTPFWEDVEFSSVDIAIAVFAAILPILVIASISFLLVAVIPSSKKFAGAVAYIFWIGSYMVFGFTLAIEALSDFQGFFIYYYYNAGDLINDGIKWGDWVLLLAISVVLLGVAWWRVDEKELGI